jgi:hypothetical protein
MKLFSRLSLLPMFLSIVLSGFLFSLNISEDTLLGYIAFSGIFFLLSALLSSILHSIALHSGVPLRDLVTNSLKSFFGEAFPYFRSSIPLCVLIALFYIIILLLANVAYFSLKVPFLSSDCSSDYSFAFFVESLVISLIPLCFISRS